MEYKRIDVSHIDALWELQKKFKAEIGENTPDDISKDDISTDDTAKEHLAEAISKEKIIFYGAWADASLIGCCSITVGFSTFNYMPSGVFDDFFICPVFRHKGIARQLVQFAYQSSGVHSMTVACADCDVRMYQSLGFTFHLGNSLAFE